MCPSPRSKKAAVIRRRYECGGIEPLLRVSEHYRPREGGIKKRSNWVARIPVVRRVVPKLRGERKPGLKGHDTVNSPFADHLSSNATFAAEKSPTVSERQFIGCRYGAHVPNVVGCKSPIRARNVRV